MKAISYDQFGGADVFHHADLPDPVAGENDVVVDIDARSINLIDIRVRSGMMGPLVNKRFPKIPGADFAGRVAAIGAKVRDLRVGDAVFGAADPFKGGAFADRIAVPAGQVAPVPSGLASDEASALPVAGLAALQSLRDLGGVKAGSRVLVHGATGPLGIYAVQLAKLMGARVTAVAGAGLDVTATEPLPAESPLWDMPQVIITPHVGGQSARRADDMTDFFCENLRRYQAGQPLKNEVDKRLGYPRWSP